VSWNLAIDEPQRFELLAPGSIAAAVDLAVQHGADAALLAGGCDLLDQLKHQWRTYRYVINLKTIGGLQGIREEPAALRVGALATLAQVAASEPIRRLLPGYAEAASRVATPQIRNLGTAGGNLLQDSRCPYYRGPWHCYRAGGIVCDAHHGINLEHAIFGGDRCYTVSPSDTAPMLVALDALALVHDPGGETTRPLAELFVSPGENIRMMHRLAAGQILTELAIPLRPGRRSAFVKYAMREAWDFAAASVAVAFLEQGGVCRECRVVLGGVAPLPWRSRSAEAVLEGRRLTPAIIEAAAAAAVEGADPLEHNGYKVALVQKGVGEALAQLT